jgi:hypothetical protein
MNWRTHFVRFITSYWMAELTQRGWIDQAGAECEAGERLEGKSVFLFTYGLTVRVSTSASALPARRRSSYEAGLPPGVMQILSAAR